MLDSPRCREWTPLATQQLRLRSLIQIVGYNIRPPECCPRLPVDACTYYYTLHETVHSAPLYTSEKIASPHPKWREIAGVTTRRASRNLVVRIWWHAHADPHQTRPRDIVVQTWGVYLSGLRLIGANPALDFTADSFKSNTLVFQLHGGYFCSYKSLNLDSIPTENLYEYSVSSGSSAASSNIPIEANYLQHHRIIKESRSISPNKGRNFKEDECSKSHSPTERGFKQNCTRLRPSQSVNIHQLDTGVGEEDGLLEVRVYSSSETNCVRLETTTSTLDIPKCRYLALNFLKSEVRPSYSASKLQELHLLQYAIKKRQDAVQEIKEKIHKKSAVEADEGAPRLGASRSSLFCVEHEIQQPERADLPPAIAAPRPALRLNDLLSMQTRPSPHERLAHARLTRQLEVLRFKRLLLADERDAKMAAIRRLKQRLAKLIEDNQDIGSELMTGYHALARRGERLRQARQSCGALRELCARSAVALHDSQARHLTRLEDVFPIKHEGGRWSICGCALSIFDDDAPRRPATFTDAVAAGLAAQCCQVAAMLLCRPLRYPVRVCGSTTEIHDHLKPELPDPRIPLYPRGGDSAMFRYGMFLLNKNCAQLLWERGLGVSDIRPTLYNLSRLLREHRTRSETCMLSSGTCGASLRSLVASERLQHRQFNRFKDAGEVRTHRHCRSAGSYTDQTDEHMATLSQLGSEPLLHEADAATALNKHNSDSQISRLSTDTRRALFTLGDDAEPLSVNITINDGNSTTHQPADCRVSRPHQSDSCVIQLEPISNTQERESAGLVSETSRLVIEDSEADQKSVVQTNSELLDKSNPIEDGKQPSIAEEVMAIELADITIDTIGEGCDCRKGYGVSIQCSEAGNL